MSHSDRHDPPKRQGGVYKLTKGHSCFLCQQRKVRCDRNKPCSNCLKAGAECTVSTASTPRRRCRKEPEQDLIKRLNKYETLMAKHGIKFEDDLELPAHLMRAAVSPPLITTIPARSSWKSAVLKHDDDSVCVDNTLRIGPAEELQHDTTQRSSSSRGTTSSEMLETNVYSEGTNILLSQNVQSLHNHHPQPVQIFRLWQTCLDNVNPLVKLFHAPTLQQTILNATGNLKEVPEDTEALMFAIYISAIVSMDEAERQTVMGEGKKALIFKYSIAAQQALINARVVKTRSMTALQAFTLFLLSMRQHYDLTTLSILSGVAVRIGLRLGMHQESALGEVPVFESEIRRRLWWQIITMDLRYAQLAGTSVMIQDYHVKKALNVNDSDLYPTMKALPKDHDGATEMLFCCIRNDIDEFMRQNSLCRQNMTAAELARPIFETIVVGDKRVDELEAQLEDKYIKSCDPSIPFHQLCILLARTAICRCRLEVHHPRHYHDKGVDIPQEERDKWLRWSLQMIENDNTAFATKGMQNFHWHIQMDFQLDAFILVLRQLYHQVIGDVVDHAWSLVAQAYENHAFMLADMQNPLYFTMGNLAVKVWERRVVEMKRIGKSDQLTQPSFIAKLLEQRKRRSVVAESCLPEAESARSLVHSEAGVRLITSQTLQVTHAGYAEAIRAFNLSLPSDYAPTEVDAGDLQYWKMLLADCHLPVLEGFEQFG